MSYNLPGSVFLSCRAILQWPQQDPDVPCGRIAEAQLYWYNDENDHRDVECTLYYAEQDPGLPLTAGLYDINTTVCTLPPFILYKL
jgi:hypothetical protein